MSDPFTPLPLARLLDWIRRERAASGTIFGLATELLRLDLSGRPYACRRHGRRLDAPIGVAAGPHTQLSQNIVAAWLCGARVIELKTVQVRDDLAIARPCIDMQDEGYNCEWSQELPLAASFAQYADAWTAVRLLQLEAGVYDPAEPGFLFDASIGYDLAGITSAPMQRYLDNLTGARAEIAGRLAAARSVWPRCEVVEPPASLTASVTLSTMHGCPPEEIERIALHLIRERGLHTSVKLNPTLLGERELRDLLVGTLGYEVDVPPEVFAQDLRLDAGVDLVRSLAGAAARAGVSFSVKLTNTLACRNLRGVLPAAEPMVYLSGRALHPIAVHAALRLRETYGDELDISFCGGVDARNAARVLACRLAPITACSDLLRPGGVLRLSQYLDEIEKPADLDLRRYAQAVVRDPAYRKSTFPERTIKSARALGPVDCIAAPCVCACPVGQDVPEIMFHTARGRETEALSILLRDNPFPAVTGAVCLQPCQERCTRVHYETGVRIRDIKLHLAGAEAPVPDVAPPLGKSAAVIGGGPAGLSCAYHLALAGVEVTLLEAQGSVGGMLAHAIPSFRLSPDHLRSDLRRIEALGVTIRTGERIDRDRFAALRREHDLVFVAVGAQADRPLGIPGEDLPGVWPALRYLAAARRGAQPALRGEVAVIGGGNTAMDAARTAARSVGAAGMVHLLYRRTRAEMPAAREEIEAALADGVVLHELLAPQVIERRAQRLALTCQRTRLGPLEAKGRRRVETLSGSGATFVCDAIITAVGQRLDCDFLTDADLAPVADGAATRLAGVFTGGDARRLVSTVAEAIADGRQAAMQMLASLGCELVSRPRRAARDLSPAAWQARAARLAPPRSDAREEASRCLDCATRCDICVSVCPNRANIAYTVVPWRWPLARVVRDGGGWSLVPDGIFAVAQDRQTCNVVDLCNECGNCTTFCPAAGAPWRDKPRLAAAATTFAAGDRIHLLERVAAGLRIRWREDGREESLARVDDRFIYTTPAARIELAAGTFTVRAATFLDAGVASVPLRRAAELAVLLAGLGGGPLVVAGNEED